MNTNERTRLSRDFVTRTAWLYEYKLFIRKEDALTLPIPVSRGSYSRLSIDELLRLERCERSGEDWTALGICEVYETAVIIGRSKDEFLKSPILAMGERLKLNTET